MHPAIAIDGPAASGKSSAAEVGVNSRMTELIVSLTFFRIGKYFISFV